MESLLLVDHFDAVASGKEFELFHRDVFFSTEVPAHQILELACGELKATSLDEAFEVRNSHLLSVLVLDAIEKALKELVVLLLISVLIGIRGVESPHELAELLLANPIWLAILGVPA